MKKCLWNQLLAPAAASSSAILRHGAFFPSRMHRPLGNRARVGSCEEDPMVRADVRRLRPRAHLVRLEVVACCLSCRGGNRARHSGIADQDATIYQRWGTQPPPPYPDSRRRISMPPTTINSLLVYPSYDSVALSSDNFFEWEELTMGSTIVSTKKA